VAQHAETEPPSLGLTVERSTAQLLVSFDVGSR